jgi:multiple sugar transport system ATP-binding protein
MAGVVLDDLTKRYDGGALAVNKLNIDIKDGEFICFVGPSGCGKTTALRMIAGLEDITSGEIRIGDRLVNDLGPAARNVAMAFETYALYPPFTVRDNLGFPLRVRQRSKEEIREAVNRIADMLNITDILDRKPKELSGGQQQCVSLGRALIRNPDVFLLDEPLSHVDTDQRVRLRMELRRVQQTMKVTSIYVTHDQLEAAALADRIAVMNLGVLQQVGTIFDLYDHPANDFVANFIGEPACNFAECNVVRQQGQLALRAADGSFTVSLPPENAQALSSRNLDKVKMGIRPMGVAVSMTQNGSAIPGTVYIFEPLGEEAVLTVQIGNNRMRTMVSPDLKVSIGQDTWLYFDPKRVHAFDPGTGVALF